MVAACKSFEGMMEITESNVFKLDEIKPKKLKDMTDRGTVVKPDDPYSKSAGLARWVTASVWHAFRPIFKTNSEFIQNKNHHRFAIFATQLLIRIWLNIT